ncbi:hypothetical protein T492DRAFT_269935 [Pavlovales sp. CCMP2436]|nr:hypothetical protein T492DRAFT_269935 [Pavlovales sp. CCMP2436]
MLYLPLQRVRFLRDAVVRFLLLVRSSDTQLSPLCPLYPQVACFACGTNNSDAHRYALTRLHRSFLLLFILVLLLFTARRIHALVTQPYPGAALTRCPAALRRRPEWRKLLAPTHQGAGEGREGCDGPDLPHTGTPTVFVYMSVLLPLLSILTLLKACLPTFLLPPPPPPPPPGNTAPFRWWLYRRQRHSQLSLLP